MPVYEFECRQCGLRFTRIMHHTEYHEPPCPDCASETDQMFDGGNGGSFFKQTPGKDTGVYDHEYGKKATWDLTVPGKMERLRKEGRIKDWL